jgi:lauroyl/myristoyl acyltransferase
MIMDTELKLTFLESGQLALANLMGKLPVPLNSAIGDYVGRQIAQKAIRENVPWIKDIHNNFKVLRGIDSVSHREKEIIAWAGRVGRVHMDYLILQRMAKEGRLEVLGQENLENTTRPVIFTSCHLSSWEMIGYVFAPLPIPFCTLYAPPENPVYLHLAIQARKAWRNTNSEFIPASPYAMFALTRGLAQGKNLVLFIDEERDGYIWGPSLGRKLPYAGNRWLAARLAVRYQVDIIPLYVEQIANARYRVVIEPKLEQGSGDAENQARFFADQIDQRCDRWVREHLEDWYWLSWLDLDKPLPY